MEALKIVDIQKTVTGKVLSGLHIKLLAKRYQTTFEEALYDYVDEQKEEFISNNEFLSFDESEESHQKVFDELLDSMLEDGAILNKESLEDKEELLGLLIEGINFNSRKWRVLEREIHEMIRENQAYEHNVYAYHGVSKSKFY